jgi:hypothetical protein
MKTVVIALIIFALVATGITLLAEHLIDRYWPEGDE